MENAYAVIIGIANYQNINKLPPTVIKDAKDIHKLLIDPYHCGYLPDNTHLLLDEQATDSAIREELNSLARICNTDSTLFLYISSHGGRIETGKYAEEYLLPVNTVYASDKSIADTAISGTEFSNVIGSIKCRKILIIFDCCHSGGIGHIKSPMIPKLDFLPESYYNALQKGKGRVIIASSRSTETSHILPNAKNSLFTQHLLTGLKGSIPSEDGLIRVFDFFEYIQPRVTCDRHDQHPVFKAEIEENFPIALYLGSKKGVIHRDEQGYRYDAYISYVDIQPDTKWVWETLLPRLEEAGLRIAVSGDVEIPGVDRVVSIERGIKQAKRTIIVLSQSYLKDHMANFENVLSQTIGIQEGTYRLVPVIFKELKKKMLPVRLGMLNMVNLSHPYRSEREFERLIRALKGSLPIRGS